MWCQIHLMSGLYLNYSGLKVKLCPNCSVPTKSLKFGSKVIKIVMF